MEFENKVIEECVNLNADAAFIPETTRGKSFIDKCKKIEKDIYINDSNAEAARFIRKTIFDKLGGFDEEFDGLDEYAFHALLEKHNIIPKRVQSRIFINDEFSLGRDLHKKFYRGQELRKFRKKYPRDAKSRFSSTRLQSYKKHYKTLLTNPLHSSALFCIKSLEASSFFLGSLFPHRKIEEVKDTFDKESVRYEQEMYLNTLGARFVDKIEKNAILPEFSNNKKILDLGVGTGRWSREFVSLGNDVTGVDISRNMLDVARKNIPSYRFVPVQSNMESLPFADEEFDIINCVRAVKYVGNSQAVFRAMNRVLKDDGKLVLEVSNKSLLISPLYYLAKALQSIKLNKGIFNYLSHAKLYSKRGIQKELELSGFKVEKIKPLFIVPATIYCKIDNKTLFSAVTSLERFFSSILPPSLFSRSFVIVARKVG